MNASNVGAPNHMTNPRETQANQVPLSELRAAAHKHYDELATQVHHWMSTIPRAIDCYFDQQEAVAASGSPPSPELAEAILKVIPAEWWGTRAIDGAHLGNYLAEYVGELRASSGSTGLSNDEKESVVREMVANISDRYLAKLSCGRNADDRREGAACHPREEHERVMVATFCGFLKFDVKDKPTSAPEKP